MHDELRIGLQRRNPVADVRPPVGPRCLTMEIEIVMSKRELITRELDQMPEPDLDKLLAFLGSLKEAHTDTAMSTRAAESSLSKDWLTPEEDAAWANL
jgi:hypothetical protein